MNLFFCYTLKFLCYSVILDRWRNTLRHTPPTTIYSTLIRDNYVSSHYVLISWIWWSMLILLLGSWPFLVWRFRLCGFRFPPAFTLTSFTPIWTASSCLNRIISYHVSTDFSARVSRSTHGHAQLTGCCWPLSGDARWWKRTCPFSEG